jgi:hypothetical protein
VGDYSISNVNKVEKILGSYKECTIPKTLTIQKTLTVLDTENSLYLNVKADDVANGQRALAHVKCHTKGD